MTTRLADRRASAEGVTREPPDPASCTLHIALANASSRPARFEARFWSNDGRACDELAFMGQLGPHASRQFELPERALRHVADRPRPQRAGDASPRSGWFEIEASEDVHASAWQVLGAAEDRNSAAAPGWVQPLDAREARVAPAAPSVAAGSEQVPHAEPALLRPPDAQPPRSPPAGRPSVERRKDPRCAVMQQEIDALDRELLGLRTQWADAASSRRPGLDLLIEAVCAEQRGLANEAVRIGCSGIRCNATLADHRPPSSQPRLYTEPQAPLRKSAAG